MDLRSLQREEQECLRQADALRAEADRHHLAARDFETSDDIDRARSHSKEALLFEGKAKSFIDKADRLKQQIQKLTDQADELEREINELRDRRAAITGE